MSQDPEDPVDPFPAPPADSPFPPLGREFEALAARDGVALPPSATETTPQDAPAPRASALVAFGRFAFPPAPPLEDADLAARDRRWTSRVIVYVAALMLAFNAASIQNWSRQQEPGWITSTVQQLSDVWSAQAALLGADRPRQAVRDAWTRLAALRFPGQESAGAAEAGSSPQ